jgi:hypothetical protein
MNDTVHVDDAFDFLIRKLADVPEDQPPNNRPDGYNVKISEIADAYWWQRTQIHLQNMQAPEIDPYYQPFYDGAWRLCLMGVLRPGQFTKTTGIRGPGFDGDGYSLTTFGRTWVKRAEPRPTSDPSRFGFLLAQFEARFGPGYGQRAAEAVGCYLTGNHLACCVLSGAAAESILLAIAIVKSGDEQRVLAEYRTASGRRRVTNAIVGNVTKPIPEHFTTALSIISFWRDEAGHGLRTTISEIEAYGALSHLIRLAQFSTDNWGTLTA